MRFLSTLALPVLTFALSAVSVHIPSKRDVVPGAHGTIVDPASDSVIAPGTSFPFSYQQANYCHGGYSPISVYLCSSPPTATEVTSNGELTDGSFLFKFGDYLLPNFGLPQIGTPPPATLTMPAVDEVGGTTLYFAVVETFENCPPDSHEDFGLETTTVVLAQ